MKRVLLTACFAVVCLGQQASPARGWWDLKCDEQTSDGHIYHLCGHAELRGTDILFRADQIDYDEIKFAVHLNGHVTIETSAVAISADEVDYDVNSGDLHASRGDVRMKLKQVAK